MSDVFISYKRDDEVRVGRLVQVLQKHGLAVWWDLGLPGGEPWRANIETALTQARCAVVVWTNASVGVDGGFVKDEAARAARRNILVPVMFDRVDQPVGFGELQAIDLTRWSGSPSDPYLLDLVAALRAKMDGRPVPPPFGPIHRLRRRLTVGGAVSAALVLASAFATNTLNFQNATCGMPLVQPLLSDACGALGLGARPTEAERVAWAQRQSGDCEAFRQHIRQFPHGAYRDLAQAMVAAPNKTPLETWMLLNRDLPMTVGHGDAPESVTKEAAQVAAVERGQLKAKARCEAFAASGLSRFVRAEARPEQWFCEPLPRGVVCGFEGQAVCTLEEISKSETETCAVVLPN